MNDDRAFRRVAIRHDVLPMLSALARARPRAGPRPPGRHPPFRVGVPRRAGLPRVARRRPTVGACPGRAPAARSRAARCASGSARRRRRRRRSSACSRSRPATRARRSSPAAARCVVTPDASSWTSTSFTCRGPERDRTRRRQRGRAAVADHGARQGAHRRLRGPAAVARRRAQGRVRVHERPVARDRSARSSSTSWPSRRTARRRGRAVSCAS